MTDVKGESTQKTNACNEKKLKGNRRRGLGYFCNLKKYCTAIKVTVTKTTTANERKRFKE